MKENNNRAWNAKSRGGAFGHRFFIFLIRTLGIRFAYAFLGLVVIYFIPFAPKATKAIWYYYRVILRKGTCKSLCLLYMHYYRFGQTLIDKIAITGGLSDKYNFEFENYEEFLRILDSGDGAIMIGAHVGAWEIGSQFFGDYSKRINVVMYDAEYERIKEVMEASTRGRNYKVIPVNQDSLDSILAIKNALDKGEYVCFQGDRFLNEGKSLEHAFLGKQASFPYGPFLIAAKMRKPVIFYYSVREGMRYRFSFTLPQKEPAQRWTPEELLSRYTDSLEAIVKQYPQQWFNFYKFWK